MITLKAALDITKTMFCSIIDYCKEKDLQDLQPLQTQALRRRYRVKNPIDVHVNDLHINSNIKLVDTRRKRQILTCIWRNITNGVIEIAKPERETRLNTAPSIYLPVPTTTIFKKSVYYYGATLWNTLPGETRLCNKLDEFKSKIYKEM